MPKLFTKLTKIVDEYEFDEIVQNQFEEIISTLGLLKYYYDHLYNR